MTLRERQAVALIRRNLTPGQDPDKDFLLRLIARLT